MSEDPGRLQFTQLRLGTRDDDLAELLAERVGPALSRDHVRAVVGPGPILVLTLSGPALARLAELIGIDPT